MKKLVALLLVLVCVCTFAFANGETENAADKVYTIQIGHTFSVESTRHKALEIFKQECEEKSNGRLEVVIQAGGVLGSEADMQESMKMGTLEAFVGGPFDTITPKLNLILMPFFYEDQDALMRVANSEIGQVIIEDAKKNNLQILSIGDGGSRQFTNNVHEIRAPKDLKGLKMRIPGIDSIKQCMLALGANPVSIPFADVYMALKTGVADGQENPIATIGDGKFYEVQKYLTKIDYQFHPEVFTMNLDYYNNLPEDLRAIVDEAAQHYGVNQNKFRLDMDKEYIANIEKSDCQIYYPTAAEKAAFMEACQPVYDYFIEKGDFTAEELARTKAISQGK